MQQSPKPVSCSSFLTYASKEPLISPEAIEAKKRVRAIKERKHKGYIDEAVRDLAFDVHLIDWFLGTTLVPCPGRAPQAPTDRISIPHVICNELMAQGMGREVLDVLKRVDVVPKSAYQSGREDRPTVERHYDSMEVFQEQGLDLHENGRIVVVDDVITLGSTLLAACQRVKERYPDREVNAFALIRHIFPERFKQYIDPVWNGCIVAEGERASFKSLD